MIEPRTIKVTEIDRRYYVKLSDVERLLHDMRREIIENAACEEHEDGTKKRHFTDAETDRLNDLFFVSSCLRMRLIKGLGPDEIRELHEKIRRDYYMGKFYLSQTAEVEGDKKELMYFRKYCPEAMASRLREEGKTDEEIQSAIEDEQGDPAFTTESRYARLFESMEEADAQAKYLNHSHGMNLSVYPAWMLDNKSAKKVLDAILGKNQKEEEEETKE